MSENRIPRWFKIISIIAILWNGMGLMKFIGFLFLSPEVIAMYPPDQQYLYQNIAFLTTFSFGLATICGFLGSITLFQRKALSHFLLLASLIGLILQTYDSFFILKAQDVLGTSFVALQVMLIFVAIGLVILAKSSNKKGWLS